MIERHAHHDEATVYYENREDGEIKKIDAEVTILPNWVMADAQWIPRERVDMIVT